MPFSGGLRTKIQGAPPLQLTGLNDAHFEHSLQLTFNCSKWTFKIRQVDFYDKVSDKQGVIHLCLYCDENPLMFPKANRTGETWLGIYEVSLSICLVPQVKRQNKLNHQALRQQPIWRNIPQNKDPSRHHWKGKTVWGIFIWFW